MTKKIVLFVSLSFLLTSPVWAGDKIATIKNVSGTVTFYEGGKGVGKTVEYPGMALYERDRISTGSHGSSVLITYADGSNALFKQNSIFTMKKKSLISIGKGRAFFRILKQKSNLFKVKSSSVMIGVRGTTFLVENNEEGLSVSLKEGRLNLKSETGEFIHFAADEEKAFRQYIDDTNKEFNHFKEEMERDFARFVKELNMEDGGAVLINGNKSKDMTISDEIMDEFMGFENMLEKA